LALRELEKNKYDCVAATVVAILIIVSVPLLLGGLSLRYAHIIAPEFALFGFLVPLGLPG